ncbi:MAG TPA: hypothetical protein DEQ61_03575, partial [Streptomyces sp.]|nr:hypothetical protein [Streptomyces sp.]
GNDGAGGAVERRAKGGKGRAFTGVAAAAVTTVLAIVVAGQVADGGNGGIPVVGDGQRDDSQDASRSDQRPEPAESPAAVPLSYADKLAQENPLDPELAGSGEFETVGGSGKGSGKGQVLRYRVDVEKGLPLDAEFFAQAVQKTLNDKRSWSHDGAYSFERVSEGRSDFAITLASPGTTATWCAKSGLDTTVDNVSCDSAATDRVMINAYRWARGSKTFENKISEYREMLINHEVGHRLGLNHERCGAEGARAPVMMQQTKSLTSRGLTCRTNAWPFP